MRLARSRISSRPSELITSACALLTVEELIRTLAVCRDPTSVTGRAKGMAGLPASCPTGISAGHGSVRLALERVSNVINAPQTSSKPTAELPLNIHCHRRRTLTQPASQPDPCEIDRYGTL